MPITLIHSFSPRRSWKPPSVTSAAASLCSPTIGATGGYSLHRTPQTPFTVTPFATLPSAPLAGTVCTVHRESHLQSPPSQPYHQRQWQVQSAACTTNPIYNHSLHSPTIGANGRYSLQRTPRIPIEINMWSNSKECPTIEEHTCAIVSLSQTALLCSVTNSATGYSLVAN